MGNWKTERTRFDSRIFCANPFSSIFLQQPQMSLAECLEEAHLAVEMFLNNNFEEARNIVQPM